MKLKGFYKAKHTIIWAKRQPKEWENIHTDYTYNAGLVSKIYKELKIWTLRKQITQLENGV